MARLVVWCAWWLGLEQEAQAWASQVPYGVALARVNALYATNREEWRRERCCLYCRYGK